MVTYAICGERIDSPLVFIEGIKDVYPYPKGLHIAPFKTQIAAQKYLDKHIDKINKLLEKKNFIGYTATVIKVDAPYVLKGNYYSN